MHKLRIIFYHILVIFIAITNSASASEKFSVKVIPPDKTSKTLGYDFTSIFIDGSFDLNSPEKVQSAVNQVHSGSIFFHLNSPGGSLLAGMQIGRIIRQIGGETYVQKFKIPIDNSVDNSESGECFSACTLAFLGGIHRYIDKQSVYGVHRFSKDSTQSTDLDVAQIMSAAITDYIVEMGVSPKLFNKMVEAGSGEIRILNQQELKDLQVVNGNSGKPEWSIEAIKGGMYLRGMQDSIWGFGKMVFTCGSKGIVLQSVYGAGERAKEIADAANFNTFKINDKNYPLPKGQRFLNNGYINNINLIPLNLVQEIEKAISIGYSMQVADGAPFFYGFSIDIGTEHNRELIKNYLNNCIISQ